MGSVRGPIVRRGLYERADASVYHLLAEVDQLVAESVGEANGSSRPEAVTEYV